MRRKASPTSLSAARNAASPVKTKETTMAVSARCSLLSARIAEKNAKFRLSRKTIALSTAASVLKTIGIKSRTNQKAFGIRRRLFLIVCGACTLDPFILRRGKPPKQHPAPKNPSRYDPDTSPGNAQMPAGIPPHSPHGCRAGIHAGPDDPYWNDI